MSTRPDNSTAGYIWDALTERQIEIVGEAPRTPRRVDEDPAARIPHVHTIIVMRNVLVHGYAQVDSSIAWTAATVDVSDLTPVVEALLGESENELVTAEFPCVAEAKPAGVSDQEQQVKNPVASSSSARDPACS